MKKNARLVAAIAMELPTLGSEAHNLGAVTQMEMLSLLLSIGLVFTRLA
jgi:hypothetical protein